MSKNEIAVTQLIWKDPKEILPEDDRKCLIIEDRLLRGNDDRIFWVRYDHPIFHNDGGSWPIEDVLCWSYVDIPEFHKDSISSLQLKINDIAFKVTRELESIARFKMDFLQANISLQNKIDKLYSAMNKNDKHNYPSE